MPSARAELSRIHQAHTSVIWCWLKGGAGDGRTPLGVLSLSVRMSLLLMKERNVFKKVTKRHV